MRKLILSLLFATCVCGANAASIGFDDSSYSGNSSVTVNVLFDFVDTPAFGGGFNLLFDSAVLEFVSYTQAIFSGSPGTPQFGLASPIGDLINPGEYLGAGVGTFEFFTGINTAGTIGTFLFNIIGSAPGGTPPCGATLCLTPVSLNPVVSLVGDDISADVFANGIAAANVSAIPLPAAAWFFGTALIGLVGLKRRMDQRIKTS